VKMQIKIMLVLSLDEDEYPMPADGLVEEEIAAALREFIHDVDGISIKTIRMTSE